MKTKTDKKILKASGLILDAWQKENVTGNMQHYVKLLDDMTKEEDIYSKWGDLPEDIVIGARAEIDHTVDGKYKNIVDYVITDTTNAGDPSPGVTTKLPPQATLDDITLKDVWKKLIEMELAIAKLGVKD